MIKPDKQLINEEAKLPRLNLKRITAICIDGRPLTPELKKNYQTIINYMISIVDFYEIKLFATVNPNINGITFIKIPEMDITDYSKFCIFRLANEIESDFCLIFQDDGFIVNPNLWNDEFYNYDWIGAPWPLTIGWPTVGNQVGNGGFSLRSKKLIKWTATLTDWASQNEDTFIVSYKKNELINQGLKIAPINIAIQFAVENEMNSDHGLHSTFGFHGKNKMNQVLEKIKKK